MGATPLFALNLVGWPRDKLPFDLLGEVLRGGAGRGGRRGRVRAGRTLVDDPEPKYGMAAIGEAHPDRIVTNGRRPAGRRAGADKPLGTGVLTTALKRDLLSEAT